MMNAKALFAVPPLVILASCSSQIYMDKADLQKITSEKTFTFMAQRAIPSSGDVVNVLNSLPYRGSSQMLDLSYGYTVVLNPQTVTVALPYFGTAYIPSMDNSKNGYNFTSKTFEVQQQTGKKGDQIFIIKPKDVQYVQSITIQIFKNGAAYAFINSNDRQPISYDGYIMKNQDK